MFTCFNSLSFLWNLGFTLGFSTMCQMVTGLMLSCSYDASNAYESIDSTISDSKGWMWSQAHSTGSTLYFLMLYTHMIKSLVSHGTSTGSWYSGISIYGLSLVVALLGYALANGNMALWALTVVSSLFQSLPGGSEMFKIVMGDFTISNMVMPSTYTIHFALGLFMIVMMMWHLSEVHKAESVTDLKVSSVFGGQDFMGSGAMKDSLMMVVYLSLLTKSFHENSLLSTLSLDVHAVDWPQPEKTPDPMGPEWYVLPLYAGLKLSSLNTTVVSGLMIFTFFFLLNSINTSSALLIWSSLNIQGFMALNGHMAIEEFQIMASHLVFNCMKKLGSVK